MKRVFGNFRKFDGIDESFDDYNLIIIVNKSIATVLHDDFVVKIL